MEYRFSCFGHPNISCKHKNTFEFTKDDFVTETGDCIVGCKATFDGKELKEFISKVGGIDNERKGLDNQDSIKEKDSGKEIENNTVIGNKENRIENSKNDVKIKIMIEVDGISEEVTAVLNADFSDSTEIVGRKGDFLSERTLFLHCNRASKDFSDTFREKLKDSESEIQVAFLCK